MDEKKSKYHNFGDNLEFGIDWKQYLCDLERETGVNFSELYEKFNSPKIQQPKFGVPIAIDAFDAEGNKIQATETQLYPFA